MRTTKTFWRELIKLHAPQKYKGWPREVSLRMSNDESYWNGDVFRIDELVDRYDNEDKLAIHFYTRGPQKYQELCDTIYIAIPKHILSI